MVNLYSWINLTFTSWIIEVSPTWINYFMTIPLLYGYFRIDRVTSKTLNRFNVKLFCTYNIKTIETKNKSN